MTLRIGIVDRERNGVNTNENTFCISGQLRVERLRPRDFFLYIQCQSPDTSILSNINDA